MKTLTKEREIIDYEISPRANWLLTRQEVTPLVEDVGPELAAELLKYNAENRPVNEKRVTEYTEQIQAGKWVVNGQTVVISNKGLLRDGQHRLMGIVRGGVPVKVLIACGVEDSTYTTLDTGMKREAGHVLAMEGYRYYAMTAGALKEFAAYDRGLNVSKNLSGKYVFTNSDTLELAKEFDREYLESMALQTHRYSTKSRFLPTAMLMGYLLVLDKYHPAKWKTFFDKVYFGLGVEESTPEYWLINRMRREAESTTNKTPTIVRRGLLIKAFNAYLKGKKVSTLKYSPDKEDFPRFIGS